MLNFVSGSLLHYSYCPTHPISPPYHSPTILNTVHLPLLLSKAIQDNPGRSEVIQGDPGRSRAIHNDSKRFRAILHHPSDHHIISTHPKLVLRVDCIVVGPAEYPNHSISSPQLAYIISAPPYHSYNTPYSSKPVHNLCPSSYPPNITLFALLKPQLFPIIPNHIPHLCDHAGHQENDF